MQLVANCRLSAVHVPAHHVVHRFQFSNMMLDAGYQVWLEHLVDVNRLVFFLT